MNTFKMIGSVIVCTACVSIAYWLGLILFSFQTLVIQNDSDTPITIMVYDLSWTVEIDERAVKRFRSNKGDTHFIILNSNTQDIVGNAAYLTNSSPMCNVIIVQDQLNYEVDTELRSFCHLTHW